MSYNFNEEAKETKSIRIIVFKSHTMVRLIKFEIYMNKRIGEQYTSLVKQISYKLRIATKYKCFKNLS